MVDSEVFDWGVRLTTKPFLKTRLELLTIQSEIREPQGGKSPLVKITFTGAALSNPLRLPDAQTWQAAMEAIVAETRSVIAEMKATGKPAKKR
jgi:hypothetical protein